jgi:SAM-dependent methyltransferase
VSAPFDFDEVFDADYLFFYEPLLADVTEADVDAIWRLLKLEPDMAVLDLACGHGRIANRLAERGARVTGLDATALFLDRARRDAASRSVCVDYVEGDMRLLPWTDERFDRVVSWLPPSGTSTTKTIGGSCKRPTACCVRTADSSLRTTTL